MAEARLAAPGAANQRAKERWDMRAFRTATPTCTTAPPGTQHTTTCGTLHLRRTQENPRHRVQDGHAHLHQGTTHTRCVTQHLRRDSRTTQGTAQAPHTQVV